jgi:hypothetical protein
MSFGSRAPAPAGVSVPLLSELLLLVIESEFCFADELNNIVLLCFAACKGFPENILSVLDVSSEVYPDFSSSPPLAAVEEMSLFELYLLYRAVFPEVVVESPSPVPVVPYIFLLPIADNGLF